MTHTPIAGDGEGRVRARARAGTPARRRLPPRSSDEDVTARPPPPALPARHPTAIPFIVLLARRRWSSAHRSATASSSPFNLSLILQQVTIIGIVGIAQTLVILTAGIDLSVGAIMILCSVVMGQLAVVYGVPAPIAFPLGLLVGVALRLRQRRARHPASGCRPSS